MRKRRASVRILALLAAGLLIAVVPPMQSASAAPVRHEAEGATISQGAPESTHAGFSGSGYVNYTNVTDSYVEWNVTAAAAGTATLTIRYANGIAGNRPMDISVNGEVVAQRPFATTGAWTTWASTTLTAPLNAGANAIRATATTAGGGPNVDYLETDAAATPGADFQAENATIEQGLVESNHAGFTGTGFVNYNNVAGSFVEWTVPATAAGNTALTIRYANGSAANRPMDISVNGAVVAQRPFATTGAWTSWAEATIPATLRLGDNMIRATATTAGGGPNVDRLSLGGDSERPTTPGQPSCSNIGQTTLTLTWGASTDDTGVVAYDIYHDGTKIDEAPGNTTTRNLTGLNSNFEYRLSVFARDAAGNVSDTSALATCRTLPPDTGDTTPPTAPTNLVHSNVGQTSVTLTWTASTDVGTGVRAYLVRNAADQVVHTITGTPPATTTVVPNLACGTEHTLHVVARDGANLLSGRSNTRTFTTSACGRGQPQTPTNVSTGWTIPWDIDWAPNGQFALITERDHFRVWRVSLSGQKTQVGTVPNSVTTGGEGGLMGVAFSPTWNGTSDQEVFFMHTSNDGGATQNRVVKMNFNGTSLSNRQVILAGIRSNRFHNGGRIKFGPDGFLYVTAGDAQQDGNGQNRDALNGKILRITKTGAAAPGNPFGTRIYSWGHRNPQGLAWDSQGQLWSSELMNNANDELNLILPGRNYGWPTCQGRCNVPGMENPKRTWSVAEASPSGIGIVNDTVYMAALRGQRLWRIELNGTSVGNVSNHFVGTFGRLRAVSKVPGASALWIGTTNADNNGGAPDGADRILRSEIR